MSMFYFTNVENMTYDITNYLYIAINLCLSITLFDRSVHFPYTKKKWYEEK